MNLPVLTTCKTNSHRSGPLAGSVLQQTDAKELGNCDATLASWNALRKCIPDMQFGTHFLVVGVLYSLKLLADA